MATRIGPPPVVTLRGGFNAPLPVSQQLHVSPVETIVNPFQALPQPPLPTHAVGASFPHHQNIQHAQHSSNQQNYAPQSEVNYHQNHVTTTTASTFVAAPSVDQTYGMAPPSPTRMGEVQKYFLPTNNSYASDVHVANSAARNVPPPSGFAAVLPPIVTSNVMPTAVVPSNMAHTTSVTNFTNLMPMPMHINAVPPALHVKPLQNLSQQLKVSLEWGPTGESVQHYWYAGDGVLPTQYPSAGPSAPHDDLDIIIDDGLIVRAEGVLGENGEVPDKGRVAQFVAAVGQHYGPKTRLTRKGDLDADAENIGFEGSSGLPTVEEIFLLGQLFWPEHAIDLNSLVLYADGAVFDYSRGDTRCISVVGLQQPLVLAPRGWRRRVPLSEFISRWRDVVFSKLHRGSSQPVVPNATTIAVVDPYAAPIVVVDDSRGIIHGPPSMAYVTAPQQHQHFTHPHVERGLHATIPEYHPGSPALSPMTATRFAPPPSPSTFEPSGI